MHVAKICSYKVHDQYIAFLMREYMRDPIHGYRKVTLSQILNVDMEVFSRIAEETEGSLAPPSPTQFALDVVLPEVYKEQRITAMLFQIGNSGAHGGKRDRITSSADLVPPKRRKAKDKGKGRGKGNKDSKNSRQTLPDGGALPGELVDLGCQLNPKLGRICFSFNMRKGCDNKAGSCRRGQHACLKCGSQNHGAAECKRG